MDLVTQVFYIVHMPEESDLDSKMYEQEEFAERLAKEMSLDFPGRMFSVSRIYGYFESDTNSFVEEDNKSETIYKYIGGKKYEI